MKFTLWKRHLDLRLLNMCIWVLMINLISCFLILALVNINIFIHLISDVPDQALFLKYFIFHFIYLLKAIRCMIYKKNIHTEFTTRSDVWWDFDTWQKDKKKMLRNIIEERRRQHYRCLHVLFSIVKKIKK